MKSIRGLDPVPHRSAVFKPPHRRSLADSAVKPRLTLPCTGALGLARLLRCGAAHMKQIMLHLPALAHSMCAGARRGRLVRRCRGLATSGTLGETVPSRRFLAKLLTPVWRASRRRSAGSTCGVSES